MDRHDKCSRCKYYLQYAFAIYKYSYYCIPCLAIEVEERKAAIDNLPNISPVDPPLGWSSKEEKEFIDSLYDYMRELSMWEN